MVNSLPLWMVIIDLYSLWGRYKQRRFYYWEDCMKGGTPKLLYRCRREIPETGCPTKSVTVMWRSYTSFSLLFDYANFETYTWWSKTFKRYVLCYCWSRFIWWSSWERAGLKSWCIWQTMGQSCKTLIPFLLRDY